MPVIRTRKWDCLAKATSILQRLAHYIKRAIIVANHKLKIARIRTKIFSEYKKYKGKKWVET